MDAKGRLNALAGLRWVAAAVVGVAHLPAVSHDPTLGRVAGRMLSEGLYGLTFFFVLSGFVLAFGYHARLAQPTSTTLRSYYVARVARIWPLHLFTLGLTLLLPFSPWPGGTGPFLANAFLLHAWVPDLAYIQSYNAVSWTLSIEAFFYLLCPLMLWLAGRTTAGPVRLYLMAAGVWLLTLAIVVPNMWSEGIWPLYLCNACPAARMGEFTVGLLLGLAYVRGGVRSGPAGTPRLRRLWTLAELVAVAVVVLLIYRCHRVPLLFRMNGYYIPAVAVLVAVFARERGAISRILASKPSLYLSDISFAFYLLHGIVFTYLGTLLEPHLSAWPRSALLMLANALAAAAAFHGIETPVRERIIRWLTPRKPTTLRLPAMPQSTPRAA